MMTGSNFKEFFHAEIQPAAHLLLTRSLSILTHVQIVSISFRENSNLTFTK